MSPSEIIINHTPSVINIASEQMAISLMGSPWNAEFTRLPTSTRYDLRIEKKT